MGFVGFLSFKVSVEHPRAVKTLDLQPVIPMSIPMGVRKLLNM